MVATDFAIVATNFAIVTTCFAAVTTPALSEGGEGGEGGRHRRASGREVALGR